MAGRLIATAAASACVLISMAVPATTHAASGVSRTAPVVPPAVFTTQMSVPDSGGVVHGTSGRPSLDNVGDVAFTSNAPLSTNDKNAEYDVYLRTAGGATVLISRTSSGDAANGVSNQPKISSDGRFIAFTSTATNLVTASPESTGDEQVFLYDRDPDGNGLDGSDRSLTMVSVSDAGTPGAPDGASDEPAVTDVGGMAYVAFQSAATDLVAGDVNGDDDVFLTHGGHTTLISVGESGEQSNGASGDPVVAATASDTFVAFDSLASNLVAGDTNGFSDVFLRTLPLVSVATTTLVSAQAPVSHPTYGNGPSEDPAISRDGTLVVFRSTAMYDQFVANVPEAYLYQPGGLTEIGVDITGAPVISGDGRYIAYESMPESNFNGLSGSVGHKQVFLYDRSTQFVYGVAGTPTGGQPDENAAEPSLANGGTQIAFASTAGDLVAGDTNHDEDVFLRTRDTTAPAAPTLTFGGKGWLPDTEFTIKAVDNKGSVRSGIAGFYFTGLHTSSHIHTTLGPGHGTLIEATKAGTFHFNCGEHAYCIEPTSAHYYFRARAIDKDGQLSSYTTLGPIKIDSSGPTGSGSVSPHGVASTTATLRWKGRDVGSGLKNYTVLDNVDTIGNVADFRGHILAAHVRNHTLTVKGLTTGHSYDFAVIVTDKVGNRNRDGIGELYAPHPVAHEDFPSGWRKVAGSAYYGGAAFTTSKHGIGVKFKQTHTDGFVRSSRQRPARPAARSSSSL